MSKQDIVMGCVYRMDIKSIHPFVSSLFATGTKAKLVLFCSELSQETKDYLESYNNNSEGITKIECVPFNIFLYRLHNPFSLLWPVFHLIAALTGYNPEAKINHFALKRGMNLMCARFFHYYQYLKKHKNQCNRIIFSDIRDVLFQDDPFKYYTFDGIESFAENSTIANCPTNTKMVMMGVGKKGLKAIKEKTVVCAGITCATIEYAMEYLRIMLQTFLEAWTMDMVYGADQGIHNAIMYHYIGKNIPTSVMMNMDSYTLTMGCMKMENLNMDNEGRVLNKYNQIVAILHQYDRIKEFNIEIPKLNDIK